MTNLPAVPDPSAIDVTSDPAGAICALVGPATRWLAQAVDITEINDTRAKAAAIEAYARARSLGDEAVVAAQTIRIRASQRLGAALKRESPPGRGKKSSRDGTISRQDISRCRFLDENPHIVEEAIAQADPDRLSVRTVVARIERERRQHVDDDARHVAPTDAATVETDEAGRWTMYAGDMAEVLADMSIQSVDAIVTDPPYPTESLPLWSTLAEYAADLLVPDGLLIGLTGQIVLPEVMRRIDEHLTFGWMYCQLLPAGQSRIRGRNIYQGWKPWLVYTKGTWPSGRIDWHTDVLPAVAAEKGAYQWQQSVAPAMEMIERLVPRNGVVLDPFTGSGSYGEAALLTGRRFIGVEADGERFKQAVERLGAIS